MYREYRRAGNAAYAGASGVVIDGSCMNAALLTRGQPQMPMFTRDISPKQPGDGPGSINLPVICGGVIVHPGDIILGDMDGVLVLRPAMAEELLPIPESTNIPTTKKKAAKPKCAALTMCTGPGEGAYPIPPI